MRDSATAFLLSLSAKADNPVVTARAVIAGFTAPRTREGSKRERRLRREAAAGGGGKLRHADRQRGLRRAEIRDLVGGGVKRARRRNIERVHDAIAGENI